MNEAPDRSRIELNVNGETHSLDIEHRDSLLDVLREKLDLTGAKRACDRGECGACAVLVDGEPRLSCLELAMQCEGRDVQTVEGLAQGAQLHPLQAAFADLGGSQCGYCTAGMLMTAKALLDKEPSPSRERIRQALAGNICRCTGYQQIWESVEAAARRLREEKR
jgi:carbon-monoxide dehydrogenase small subunit